MRYIPKSLILIIFTCLISVFIFTPLTLHAQICYADGDVNGDGVVLTITDMTFLSDFLYNCGPTPPDLFKADLNGDCVVDTSDINVYQEYFAFGMPAFDPYGGYPVETCCEPIVKRADIIAMLFGMQHISRGSACLETSEDTLHITDLDLVPGSIENGFDAHPTMLLGFKGWNCRFAEDPTIPVGASISTDFTGNVEGLPDRFIASMRQDKRPDGRWDIWIQALPGTYQIDGYLNTGIRQDRGSWTTNNTAWVNIGSLGSKSKGPNNGPYDMSIANMDDAGRLDLCFGTEDSALWTWEDEGIIDQLITTLSFRRVEDPGQIIISDISNLSQFGINLPAYNIINENYTFVNGDFNITNIGSAVIDPIASSLIVTNQSLTSPYGLAVWPNPESQTSFDFTRFIFVENPTFPVGSAMMCSAVDESFPAESFFDIFASGEPLPSPDFPAESFFDVFYSMKQEKVSASEWDINMISIIPAIYTVEASLGGTVLYTSPPLPATGSYDYTGTISSTSKVPNTGPHPFNMSILNDTGIISIVQPDSLIYNWPSEGILNLLIDKLQVTVIHDPLTINLIPAVTASDTTAFTLSVEGGSYSCCNHDGIRGDANNDGSILVDDLTLLVDYLFKGGPPPDCQEEGDANGDGIILVDDLTLLVDYLFKGGIPPVPCP